MTEIVARNQLVINALQGVEVDIKNAGSIEESIDILSKQPGLEYLADLKNNPNIDWKKVNAAYNAWDHSGQGLTAVAAVIIAIVIAIFTAGAGAAAMGAMGFVGAGSAAAGTAAVGATVTVTAATATTAAVTATVVSATTMAAMSAAISAAAASLASTSLISTINNGGDMGAVMKEIGSDEYLKQLAISVITAGATAGTANAVGLGDTVNSNTLNQNSTATLGQRIDYAVIKSGVGASTESLINGTDFEDSLQNRLQNGIAGAFGTWGSGVAADQFAGNQDSILNTAIQGAIGCGTASAAGNDCTAGAIGGTIGSITGSHNINSDYARIIGAGASAVVSDDEEDVYTSADIAESQSGVVQYSTNNVQVAPDLAWQLKDGYDQVVNTNTVIVANYLVADIVPLPSNHGGLIRQVGAFFTSDREYMKVSIEGITKTQLKAIQSGEVKVKWEKSGDDTYMVLSSGERYLANVNTYDYDYAIDNIDIFAGVKGLFMNGIMNSPEDAIRNGLMQTNQSEFVIAYDPNHGLVPDLLEVGYNKFVGNDIQTVNMAQDNHFISAISQQNVGIIDASHSAGAVRLFLATQSNPSAFTNDLLQFSGSPVNRQDILSVNSNVISTPVIKNNPGDFVGKIIGGNAESTGEAISSIIRAPLLFTPLSTHSNYICSVCKNN